MPRIHGKQPCECGHAKGIHRARRAKIRNKDTFHSPCDFPGCKCRDYKLAKR